MNSRLVIVVLIFIIGATAAHRCVPVDDDETRRLEIEIAECSTKGNMYIEHMSSLLQHLYDLSTFNNAYNLSFGEAAPLMRDVFGQIFGVNVTGRIEEYVYEMFLSFASEYYIYLSNVGLRWNPIFNDGISRPGTYYNFYANVSQYEPNGTTAGYEVTFGYYRVFGNISQPGNFTIDWSSEVNIYERGRIRINCNGLIDWFNLNIPLLHQFFIFLREYPYTPFLQNAFNEANCNAHQEACFGTPYQQYDSFESCMSYMQNLTASRYDTSGEPATRGVEHSPICYTIHDNLAIHFPSEHCPHLGPYPTWDGMNNPCQDWTYQQFFDRIARLGLDRGQRDPSECNQHSIRCQEKQQRYAKLKCYTIPVNSTWIFP
jgi:hypothetical protein